MAPTDQKRLDAPKSNNTVRVRMIDTTSIMYLHAKPFVEPVTEGHKMINMTDVAFLIENSRNGKKAVFDLGIRKDWWNFPPKVRNRFDKLALGMRVDKDVPEILMEKGVALESINDLIWSHAHFDHTGDPSLFPPTTTLNYGPDNAQTIKPGYPLDPNASHPSTNTSNRPNNEINFSSDLRIGGFRAHDFYNDGSFYLLETPGHAPGHMCGLARTTPSDDPSVAEGHSTFVLMGGDVCHFCGDMRPNETHPMPQGEIEGIYPPSLAHHGDLPTITGEELLKQHPRFSSSPSSPCPDTEPAVTPWYQLPTGPSSAYDYPDGETARATISTLTSHFDSAANVFVGLAHDTALVYSPLIPSFNEQPERDWNGWFRAGWKDRTYWGWVGELKALEMGEKGVLVRGFWRDGKRYETAAEAIGSAPIDDGSGSGDGSEGRGGEKL